MCMCMFLIQTAAVRPCLSRTLPDVQFERCVLMVTCVLTVTCVSMNLNEIRELTCIDRIAKTVAYIPNDNTLNPTIIT